MKRVKVEVDITAKSDKPKANQYFSTPREGDVFSTGCTLLDLIMGGGMAKGRIYNIVGDFSTSKSGVATESMIGFHRAFPNAAKPFYNETENAYDHEFAQALGLQRDQYDASTKRTRTVSELFKHVEAYCAKVDPKKGGYYIVDSLDALSDSAELESDFDKSSYGASKAKDLSRFFRIITNTLAEKNVTLLIISQIRDKINAGFGERYSRSGGKALDFYASVVVYLAKLGTIKKTRKGVERKVGFRVRANNKKSKVGLPGRVVDYPIIYGFGIDDLRANIEFLAEVKRLDVLNIPQDEKLKSAEKFLDDCSKLDAKEYRSKCREVARLTKKVWKEIEDDFLPKHRKY